jgi:hypothetical protein
MCGCRLILHLQTTLLQSWALRIRMSQSLSVVVLQHPGIDATWSVPGVLSQQEDITTTPEWWTSKTCECGQNRSDIGNNLK